MNRVGRRSRRRVPNPRPIVVHYSVSKTTTAASRPVLNSVDIEEHSFDKMALGH